MTDSSPEPEAPEPDDQQPPFDPDEGPQGDSPPVEVGDQDDQDDQDD